MRIPLATSLESRDAAVSKDAKVMNALIERKGEVAFVQKRPGISDLGLVKAGVAQLITYWNGIKTIQDDYLTGAAAFAAATWNSADKGSNVALSGGDLVATTSSTSNHAVRSTISKTTGKWYWEVTIGSGTVNRIGVANATFSVSAGSGSPNSSLGLATHSLAVDRAGSVWVPNGGGTTIGSIGAMTEGDVVCIALDMDNGTVAFRKNAGTFLTVSGANVPTGAIFAAVGQYDGSDDVMTANFGASPFAFTVPTGFNEGLYTEGSLGVGTSTALNPAESDLMFSAQDNGQNAPTPYLMFKNASQAWTLSKSGVIAQITDVDYPGTYAVTLSSLTRSGTTATATTPTDTNFQVGSSVLISGAGESAYNGSKVITAVTPSVTESSEPVAVTITRSNTTATATCVSSLHGFTTGQTVVIAGADQTEYNGSKTITVTSPTTFTFTVTLTGTDVTTPATGSPVLRCRMSCHYANGSFGGTGSLEIFRVTTSNPHGLSNGDSVEIDWVSPGTYTVANATATSFTITISGHAVNSNGGFLGIYRTPAPSVSSITRSGITATVTTSAAHGLSANWQVTVSGATQQQYNLTFYPRILSSTTFEYTMEAVSAATPVTPATGTISATQTEVTPATFTFTVSGSPTTPATGTIVATGGRNTVPGIVYLNGRFYVMDVNGVIYGSEEDAPASWNALETLIAQNETGAGKAIAKSLEYLVAFKEFSTEFFYDAGNPPPGSPLGPVQNGFTQVGCASGDSVADVAGTLCWIAQEKKAKGRSVYMMSGTQQAKISTPDIDRILTEDSLAEVYAYGLKIRGRSLYVLILPDSDITLVCDIESKDWTQWSTLTAQSPASISSITRSGSTCTVTFGSAHNLSDGDPLLIAGANQSDYNGLKQVTYVSSTVVTFQTSASPVTPATGTITGTRYVESYFKFTKYANCNGRDMLLHESDGHLFEILPTEYQDDDAPINVLIRTARLDGGTSARKANGALTVVGDKVSDFIAVRWSDDDMTTSSTYRPVDLSKEEPRLRRCGAFKRRTYELRHVGDNPLRLEALELEIAK
jgi:hypothetical protein